MASTYYSPSQEFQVSHSVRFQLTYALININAISAPSDTRKGTNQQQPRFNERKTILSGDTLRQNSFQELTDSRLQKAIHDLYCILLYRLRLSQYIFNVND